MLRFRAIVKPSSQVGKYMQQQQRSLQGLVLGVPKETLEGAFTSPQKIFFRPTRTKACKHNRQLIKTQPLRVLVPLLSKTQFHRSFLRHFWCEWTSS